MIVDQREKMREKIIIGARGNGVIVDGTMMVSAAR